MCKAFLLLIGSIAALAAIPGTTTCQAADVTSLQPRAMSRFSVEQNSVLFDPSRNEYQWNYQNKEKTIQYSLRLRDPYIAKGLISLRVLADGKRRILPLRDAGLLVRSASGRIYLATDIVQEGTPTLISHRLDNNRVHLLFEDQIEDTTLTKEYIFGIQGKTLIINASSSSVSNAATGYIGFNFAPTLFTPDARIITLPSNPFPVIRIGDSYFMTTYVDPIKSTTFRYDNTEFVENIRRAQASNTPAWLIENVMGEVPDLSITAYLTVSDDILDVIPVPPKQQSEASQDLRKRVVVDLHELPLAQPPYKPLELLRVWEAPRSGLARLDGGFALQSEGSAYVEVRLIPKGETKEHVLFSQILDSTSKPVTGIQGAFPLAQGDTLQFVVTGPAVMRGGDVALNLAISFDGEQFSSIGDFSGEQGKQQWYYKQKHGLDIVPLLWNEEHGRWESVDSRSWITKERMVCRNGQPGDAFRAAKRFFNDLHAMGMNNLLFILNDWQQFTRTEAIDPSENRSNRWGDTATLQQIVRQESDRGNLISLRFPYQSVKDSLKRSLAPLVAQSILGSTNIADHSIFDSVLQQVQNSVTHINHDIPYQAMLVDRYPYHETLFRLSSLAAIYGQGVAADTLYSDLQKQAELLRERWPVPVLFHGNAERDPMEWYWAGFGQGWLLPLNRDETISHFVREDLEVGRVTGPRIGLGSYAEFYREPESRHSIDPRVNPLDQYLSSTIAFGRVPYCSDLLYHPKMTGSDYRKVFLGNYSLLAPVAAEYMRPENTITRLEYATAAGQRFNSKGMLFLDDPSEAPKIVLKYSNGLEININRSAEQWNVPQSFLPVVNIAKDGFLAVNESSGLVSLIGQLGDRTFSASRTPDSFFLHSREGVLMRIPPLGTDGMVRLWNSTIPNRRNIACIQASEIMLTKDVTPIVQLNGRADIAVNWISQDQVDIRIMDTEKDELMLEFFDLPPNWIINDENIRIQEQWVENPSELKPTEWVPVKTMQKTGIRIPRVVPGYVYSISRNENPKT